MVTPSSPVFAPSVENGHISANVPAGVVTALTNLASALVTEAFLPGRDSQLAAETLGDTYTRLNHLYR